MVKITAFFTALFTWLSMIFCPAAPVEGIFTEPEVTEKVVFDEGEFIMGEYDIVVAPYGDDSNDGSFDTPVATFEKAKELAKTADTDETVTVWFREGTYFIEDMVKFTAEDKKNVLYRSYPDEKVEFTGAKEISDWSETSVNGVKAFVSDVTVDSEDDYFRSLYKGNKRLSRSNYPKTGVLKVASEPLDNEKILSTWDEEFFVFSPV